MKKKITDQQIAQFISMCVDELNSQMDFDFRVKKSRMLRAKNQLVDSFTPLQKELFEEFEIAQQDFYQLNVE